MASQCFTSRIQNHVKNFKKWQELLLMHWMHLPVWRSISLRILSRHHQAADPWLQLAGGVPTPRKGLGSLAGSALLRICWVPVAHGFQAGAGLASTLSEVQKCHCVNICEYVREACPKLAGGKSTQLSSETDINRTFFIPESAPKKLQVTQVAWYLDTVCFLLVSSSPC